MNYWWQLSILALLSYLFCNFCAADFISNKFMHKDIRKLGSKNPGTTNMARVFGFKFGASTFTIDFLKGFACAFLGKLLFSAIGGYDIGIFDGYLAGLAAILGHNYPILHGFKGGKGFATGIGIFIAVNTPFTITLLFIGVFVLLIVDRMSVCALAFFAIEAIYHFIAYSNGSRWIPLFTVSYFILSVISHWPNIIRLVHGEEKPIGIMTNFKRAK